MNDIIKEKMDVIGKYCLLNKSSYILKLHDLMDNVNGTNAILSKNGFLDIFSDIYIKLLYIDGSSLDFICGNKIVKMDFNGIVFKNINLRPETGEYFKVELDSDKRIKNTIYLSSLLSGESFVTIDFKQLNSMLISDNDYSQNIDDDIYYGGLFKIREELKREETVKEDVIVPSEKDFGAGSLFSRNNDEQKEIKQEVITPKNNDSEVLIINDFYSIPINKFEDLKDMINNVYTEKLPDHVLRNCVKMVNFAYNTNVEEIVCGVNILTNNNRVYNFNTGFNHSNVYTLCVLKDKNTTFILGVSSNGSINLSISMTPDVKNTIYELCSFYKRYDNTKKRESFSGYNRNF